MSIFAIVIAAVIVVPVLVMDYVESVKSRKREEHEAVMEMMEAMKNGDDIIIFDDGSYAIRMKGSK